MTDIAPEPRGVGSHRRSDRRRLRMLLVSLLVVAIAAVAVVATLHWRGEDKKLPAVATKTTHPTPTPTTSSSAPAAASSSATAPATSPPAASSSAALPTATAGTPLSSPPAGPSSAGPQPPATHLPLDVLNSTHTSGLAARAAKTLSGGGWTVAVTGNYPHTLSGTTVYYPAGKLASAQLLASQFPAIGRIVAAPAGVSTTDLTVVLAKDWTASGK